MMIEPLRRGAIKLNDYVQSSGIATILNSSIPVVAERQFSQLCADHRRAEPLCRRFRSRGRRCRDSTVGEMHDACSGPQKA